jgi:hypothetical protein
MVDRIEELFIGPKSLDIGRGVDTNDRPDPALAE